MRRATRLARAALPLLVLVGTRADAHIVSARLGDFYAGALHPLTDLVDGLGWLALGLLAGLGGAERARWLVVAVPAGLLAGATLALGSGVAAGASTALVGAGALLVVGLVIAAAPPLDARAVAAIGFALAALRGVANASDLSLDADRLLYVAGLASVGYVAVTLLAAAAVAFRAPRGVPGAGWRAIALRACGSWIAAIGLMAGGFALAR